MSKKLVKGKTKNQPEFKTLPNPIFTFLGKMKAKKYPNETSLIK